MKIKISANSNISLPEQLSKIDLSYGYSFGHKDQGMSQWKTKLASKVDKIFSLFQPLNDEQKQIIVAVTEAAKFLDTHLSGTSYVEDMKIQINVKSPFNMMLKKIGKIIYKDDSKNQKQFSEMLDFNAAQIYPFTKKMAIGTEIFENNLVGSNLGYDIKKSIGLEKSVNLTVYHESAHSSQKINDELFGNKYDPDFRNLLYFAKLLGNPKNSLSINKELKNFPELGINRVNYEFMKEIDTLSKEIYADVGSILIQRNQDIINNDYSSTNTIHILDSVISARDNEVLRQRRINSRNEGVYCANADHFTSPGLEYIKDNYYKFPNRVLTQEEIHEFSNKSIEQGISRFLITIASMDTNIAGQLKLLFKFCDDEKSIKTEEVLIKKLFSDSDIEMPTIIEPDSFKNGVTYLKSLAGEDWVKNFKEKISIINAEGINNPDVKWNAAFHPKEFEIDVKTFREHNAWIDEILDMEVKKNISIDDSANNVEKVNQSAANIGNFLNKIRNEEKTNLNNKIRPH